MALADTKPLIGVIGLGNLGAAILEGLLKGGYIVLYFDKFNRTLETKNIKNGRWENDVKKIARQVDILITCMPKPPNVRELMEKEGVLENMRRGCIWIGHESTIPEETEYFSALSRDQYGVRMLEAPMTGGIELLRQFKMITIVGGPMELVEECQPILKCYTIKQIYGGPYGKPAIIKIISNMLCAVHTVVTGESLMMAVRAGINPAQFFECIRVSAGNSFVFETEAPLAFNGSFDPHFTLDLHCKDLAIGAHLARQYGVPIETFSLVEQIYNRARYKYGNGMGSSHPMKLLQDDLKTPLQTPGFENWTYDVVVSDDEGLAVVHRNISGRPTVEIPKSRL